MHRKFILFLLPVALLGAEKTKKIPPKPATAVQKSAPLSIPADAVRINDYTWRHTDKDGKSWIYRKTPFGLSKGPEETAAPAVKPDAPKPAIKVTDAGDTYRFERAMPMGAQVWTRKKSELTDEEKVLVESAAAEKH